MVSTFVKVLGYLGMVGLASLPFILWHIFFGNVDTDEEDNF